MSALSGTTIVALEQAVAAPSLPGSSVANSGQWFAKMGRRSGWSRRRVSVWGLHEADSPSVGDPLD